MFKDENWFRRASFALLMTTLLLISTITYAQIDEPDEDVGYDTIVNNLNRQVNANETATTRAKVQKPVTADPFESVWMHGGAGVIQNTQTLGLPSGQKAYLNQKGVQAAIGLDLFSINWMAEGTVRSFNETADGAVKVALKEFELKIFFKDRLAKNVGYKVGGGISGRYMTVSQTGLDPLEYTTPSSVGTVGLDLFLTDRFSIGAEVSGRTAMIGDTIDQGSLDGAVRLDAHF